MYFTYHVDVIMFTKQVEAQVAKSVDILHFLLARGLGPGTYVRTLIVGIGREGYVTRARAKAEGGRPLCVGASHRGNACLCFTTVTCVI
jgi:hypothetical protein